MISMKEINRHKEEFGDWTLDLGIPERIVSNYPKSIYELHSVISSIECLYSLVDTIAYYRSHKRKRFFFRGHSDKQYSLISSIGRTNCICYSSEQTAYRELKELFDAEGYSRYRMEFFNEELFYYGVGRHLGLTCRLLDWTAGLWEAMSFALYKNDDKDGALWVMMLPNDYPLENRSPFSIEDDGIHILKEDYYYPDDCLELPLGIQRRSHQHGFYSVVKESWISTPLNEVTSDSKCELFNFVIPKEIKEYFLQDNHLVDVDKWLYIVEDSPIINKIKEINYKITNTVGNERRKG